MYIAGTTVVAGVMAETVEVEAEAVIVAGDLSTRYISQLNSN